MTSRFAAVQYRPPKGEPDAARADLVRLVDEAGRQGAEFIVCPEMATTGYVWSDPGEIRPHCEPARGPTLEALAQKSAKAGRRSSDNFSEISRT